MLFHFLPFTVMLSCSNMTVFVFLSTGKWKKKKNRKNPKKTPQKPPKSQTLLQLINEEKNSKTSELCQACLLSEKKKIKFGLLGLFYLFFNVKSLLRTSISVSHSSLIPHFSRKRGAQGVHRWVWFQTIASCSGAISGPLWPDQGSASPIHLFLSMIVFKKISSCTTYRDRKMMKMYLWGPNDFCAVLRLQRGPTRVEAG